jgi:hypothetical protein
MITIEASTAPDSVAYRSFRNIGRVQGNRATTAITAMTSAIAARAYRAPDFQCSRPRPSSAQPRPRARTSISSATAAAGTMTTPAHAEVKWATRLVIASITTTTPMST